MIPIHPDLYNSENFVFRQNKRFCNRLPEEYLEFITKWSIWSDKWVRRTDFQFYCFTPLFLLGLLNMLIYRDRLNSFSQVACISAWRLLGDA